MSSAVLELSQQLINKPSITPHDDGCQEILDSLLQPEFSIQHLPKNKVSNLWAMHGNNGPLLVFAGHTDVVATGEESQWQHPPFKATIEGDYLCGRGAQDMKCAVAAMSLAAKQFVNKHPNHPGRIGLLITSAEEGLDYLDGTPHVLNKLAEQNISIDWCVVGEPSCSDTLGDTIRNGRRGSFKCYLTIKGKQGHVAYPHLAKNPLHMMSGFLDELTQTEWDQGNDHFPPTVMQCAYIESSTKAINVIPGTIELGISFRYSSAITHTEIEQRVLTLLEKHQVDHEVRWELSGQPFLTDESPLLDATIASIEEILDVKPQLSTGGGTSDGRFIAPTGAKVIEFGTCNDSIHKINERVRVDELEKLQAVYFSIMEKLLVQ